MKVKNEYLIFAVSKEGKTKEIKKIIWDHGKEVARLNSLKNKDGFFNETGLEDLSHFTQTFLGRNDLIDVISFSPGVSLSYYAKSNIDKDISEFAAAKLKSKINDFDLVHGGDYLVQCLYMDWDERIKVEECVMEYYNDLSTFPAANCFIGADFIKSEDCLIIKRMD